MRKLVKIIISALALSLPIGSSALDLWSGEKLLTMYESGESVKRGDNSTKSILEAFSFVAYVEGVIQSNGVFRTTFCPPNGAKSTEVMGEIAEILRTNPEARSMAAFGVVLGAAIKKWPCDKTKKNHTEESEDDEIEDKWRKTIDAFLEITMLSGGIDYRSSPEKMALFDATVRMLGHDPRNKHKSMSWFLVEADKIVKDAYKHQK